MNLKQFKADDDRISSLPDDVLTHILSFLPTKLAVATSILSTRWKHLSDFVQDIDLADDCVSGYREIDDASLFMQFVLKVLMVRTFPKIRNIPNFYLFCTIRYNHATLSQLILLLLMRDIHTLHLHVHLRETDALPDEIFTCKSLEVLEVGGELHFRIPEFVILPNLKAIELHDVDLDNDFSITKLLSGCPVLEDLLLYDCQLGKEDNMIDISHALLKNLVLNDCWGKYFMILDTPNLQSLLYASFGHVNIKVKNMMSLVHAHISWGSIEIQAGQLENQDPNLLLESSQGTSFINAMHKARFLYLEGSTLNALHFSDGPLTTFHNLIFLELGYFDICRQLVLPELLESTPNLEELVFYEGFLSYEVLARQHDHPSPNKIPACFSRRLEEIKFRVFEGHEFEVELVEYFLKNVQHLKMMMIGSLVSSISPFGYRRWNLPCLFQEETPKWVRPVTWRLSAAPRCSKYCQIVLSWGEEPKLYSWRVSSMFAYKNNYGDRDFVAA